MERYPIGQQDFKSIREGNFAYVDKTAFIPELFVHSKYYFLARPRRFGKSLFLSTLEYFFLGERELFRGLAVDSHPWDWEWRRHPVIHIDFGPKNYLSEDSVKEHLDATLSIYEEEFGVEPASDRSVDGRFLRLIRLAYEKTGLPVAVLVDEYEKPVIDTIDEPELSRRHREVLRGFYSVLKSADRYLQLVFLTGVTRFGRMNIFSGLNNLRDISLLDSFASVCGVTEDELRSAFPEGVAALAREEGTDFEGALRLLKDNYDGYHFSARCPDIYNPYSLINALASQRLNAYWALTGTPSLLARLMVQQDYDLERIQELYVTEDRLMGVNSQFEDLPVLFYQTGYLTIKEYDRELREYRLGFPNREVEKSFFQYLLPNYSRESRDTVNSQIDDFRRAVNLGEARKAMECMEAFSAGISYDVIPAPETERHFQMLLNLYVKLTASRNVRVLPEHRTSDGRIDILMETPRYVYVIELKRDSSPEEALRQIEEKGYALQYATDPRRLFLIGVNFSTEKRRIDGFLIKTKDAPAPYS